MDDYKHIFRALLLLFTFLVFGAIVRAALVPDSFGKYGSYRGGQLFSKSFVGFREYTPHWFEKEGIVVAIILTLLPLLILYIFSRFVTLGPVFSKKH